MFDPNTGEIRSGDTKSIAAWFIDTDYDEESFFVRHAYFLGANDPYKSLKTALKAEIDEDAWATLYRDSLTPVRAAGDRADRGEGDQPLRGRSDEGVFGLAPPQRKRDDLPGYNHYADCACGWCVSSGRSRRQIIGDLQRLDAAAFLSRHSVRTVSGCYVNPNARCPVCRSPVYFYANRLGSRVLL